MKRATIAVVLILMLALLIGCTKRSGQPQTATNQPEPSTASQTQASQTAPQAQPVSATQQPTQQPSQPSLESAPASAATLVYPDSLFDPGQATEDDLVRVLRDSGFTVNCFDRQNTMAANQITHECQAERRDNDTASDKAHLLSWSILFTNNHRADHVEFKFPTSETVGLRKLLHKGFGHPSKTETDKSAREFGATIPSVCEYWDEAGKWGNNIHICTVDSGDLVDSHVTRGVIAVVNWGAR